MFYAYNREDDSYVLLDAKNFTSNADYNKATEEAFNIKNRRIAKSSCWPMEVSTVFLAIDHNFSPTITRANPEFKPVLFETLTYTNLSGVAELQQIAIAHINSEAFIATPDEKRQLRDAFGEALLGSSEDITRYTSATLARKGHVKALNYAKRRRRRLLNMINVHHVGITGFKAIKLNIADPEPKETMQCLLPS